MSQTVTHYEIFTNTEQLVIGDVIGRLVQCNNVLLQKDTRGRPYLVNNEHDVNWSHSGELLAIAWSATKRVGVDIERIRERKRWLEVAGRFFEESEITELRKQNSLLAFLQLWCLKEAVIKAHGHGISYGLDKVTFAWRDGWQLHETPVDMGTGWMAQLIDVPEGYIGALAWRDR